jgi:hypothetical protein
LPPSFTAQVNTMTRPPAFTWSQYSQDVAQYARAHNSVPRTTSVLSVNAPSPDRLHANRRLSSRWDKSSPPESNNNRSSRWDKSESTRNDRQSTRGRRFPSRERSSGGDRSRDRSKSRDRSSSAGRDSRSHSSSSARSSSRQESPRKFLPPEEYKKFQELLRSAHASVIKQFFPSGGSSSSSSTSTTRGHRQAYSAHQSQLEDDTPNEVSEIEFRALVASALGEDQDDDSEDGLPDK